MRRRAPQRWIIAHLKWRRASLAWRRAPLIWMRAIGDTWSGSRGDPVGNV